MTEESDGTIEWELAGAVRVARTESGFAITGGWEEPGAVGFHVVVHHPENDELVKRQRLRVPVKVEDGTLVVGAAEVLHG